MATDHVAAIVLAAGRSRRFGRRNKLLTVLRGKPLWWWTLAAVFASSASSVVIVLPPRPRRMQRSLAAFRRTQRRALKARIVINRHHGRGLSTSVRKGISALPGNTAAAVMCLADMPLTNPRLIDALIQARQPADAAVVPVGMNGRRGNPVLLCRKLFSEASRLHGDQGFRPLLAEAAPLRFVKGQKTESIDVDTRRDYTRLRRHPRRMFCVR